jgi:chloramphenicol 3-O-phosphotransferase
MTPGILAHRMEPAVLVISGVPGAGKSTLAALVARGLPRSVHLEAERLQRFVVGGGVWPDAEPRAEAMRQLRLRGRNVALLADSFFAAGFTTIVDDVVIGSRLADLRADLRSRPLLFVLLTPSLEVLRERNRGRPGKDVFEAWRHLDAVARGETPRVGLWLDTSRQSAEESAQEILRRAWSEGRVD